MKLDKIVKIWYVVVMRFTAQEEYGLRCLLQMARHEERGAMTIPQIARAEGLTVAYVGKLMRILREGRLVESTRGQNGGYTLSRPADQIDLHEILTVLGGEIFPKNHCEKHTGNEPTCVHVSDCAIRSAWAGLDVLLGRILRTIHLKDLVRSEDSMDFWLRHLPPVAPGHLRVLP